MKTNIKDIVAVMAVKTNDSKDVSEPTKAGESDPDTLLGMIRDTEMHSGMNLEHQVEFYSEADFKEPKRANFEEFVKGIMSGEFEVAQKDITIHYLTEATI